ncbi:MAG: DNA polymerase III subunit delta [Phycisphaerales bacterium]
MAKKPASSATKNTGGKAGGKASGGSLSAATKVAVLCGPESFLQQLYTRQLRDALEAKFGEVETVMMDGTSTSAAEVLDECRSFGLLASHKIVIVDSADAVVKEDNRPLFERYVTGLASGGEEGGGLLGSSDGEMPGAVLVLRASTWRPGKLDAMIEALGDGGAVIKCEEVQEDKAAQWAITRCAKAHGATIDLAAAALLVDRVGTGLGRLDSELGKLAAAVLVDDGKKGAISRELVAQFVGMSREEEVWSIQERVVGAGGAGAEGAIRAVRDALEVSRHPAALVSYAMNDLARKLHACAHAAKQGKNFYQVRGPLRLFGAGGDAIFNAAAKMGPEACRGVLNSALEATLRDRTGLGESGRTLERLALKIAQARSGLR